MEKTNNALVAFGAIALVAFAVQLYKTYKFRRNLKKMNQALDHFEQTIHQNIQAVHRNYREQQAKIDAECDEFDAVLQQFLTEE